MNRRIFIGVITGAVAGANVGAVPPGIDCPIRIEEVTERYIDPAMKAMIEEMDAWFAEVGCR